MICIHRSGRLVGPKSDKGEDHGNLTDGQDSNLGYPRRLNGTNGYSSHAGEQHRYESKGRRSIAEGVVEWSVQ